MEFVESNFYKDRVIKTPESSFWRVICIKIELYEPQNRIFREFVFQKYNSMQTSISNYILCFPLKYDQRVTSFHTSKIVTWLLNLIASHCNQGKTVVSHSTPPKM